MSEREITPEYCYELWRKCTMAHKGINVRKQKNFDKARNRDDWTYFISFANLCNRNSGHINPVIFMTALANQYSGYFNPTLLASRKSIKIYKAYVTELEKTTSKKEIKEQILSSIKFIVKYSKVNNLSFEAYLSENMEMIPTIFKHVSSGSVSLYLLACIQNFDIMVETGYPKDMSTEYLPKFKNEYPVYRMRVLDIDDKTLRKIINNISEIVNKLINK